jgi:hypothetical protein
MITAMLPGSRPTTIISDCEGLCHQLTNLKSSFFSTYLLDDQPESHKTSLPRDGSNSGILLQALYPHLPRLQILHQKSHVEKRKKNTSLWTYAEMGNFIADRAAAQDWDNIRPWVRSLNFVTQPLPDLLRCKGGLPLPFTISPNEDIPTLFSL